MTLLFQKVSVLSYQCSLYKVDILFGIKKRDNKKLTCIIEILSAVCSLRGVSRKVVTLSTLHSRWNQLYSCSVTRKLVNLEHEKLRIITWN
jgi:hypothetical protein